MDGVLASQARFFVSAMSAPSSWIAHVLSAVDEMVTPIGTIPFEYWGAEGVPPVGVVIVTTGALFYFEGRPVTVAPMAGEVTGLVELVGY